MSHVDSDDESDEDSDDDSDWSESEEESDSESGGLDLDVCPPGCDPHMYDETCKMREKRLDIEELLSEEKRQKDVLNKELDVLQKKAKVIVMSLKSAEDELEAFQVRSNSWIIWYNHDLLDKRVIVFAQIIYRMF